MKVTVAQIMHFSKAAQVIADHVHQLNIETVDPDKRAPLQKLVAASESISNMANRLIEAEVNVKG